MASIHKRGNRYCVIYSYTTKEGLRKQKWESYRTRAEAERRKSEIEYKSQLGEFVIPTCRTLKDLLREYVSIYGKDTWSLSTYSHINSTIANYINPIIGDARLYDINTRFMEVYYQKLQNMPPVANPATGKPSSEYISSATIRKIHQLLRSCFNQAVKWELMEKNPCTYATVPKHKYKKREIWDADTLMRAIDLCDDDRLKLALNLSFTCTLRMGELLGLTWDCVDISEEAIEEGRAFIYVNKELQRVDKEALKQLSKKDVLFVFPEQKKTNTTVQVLKTPKTESSVRKVFLPRTVAQMLIDWKEKQEEAKAVLDEEYHDYNLVLASSFGMPTTNSFIRNALNRLIREHDLDPIVFHSLRHTSVTYKLKLNGGDIKAVQGDSGHAQVNMVTDVYSRILDSDRKKNAQLFEDAFYQTHTAEPQTFRQGAAGGKEMEGQNTPQIPIPDGVDLELLAKILTNPEMLTLLTSMAKALK